MSAVTCEVIRDLLPLYIDCTCSHASSQLVEEHLAACPQCRDIHRRMTAGLPPAPSPAPDNSARLFRRMYRKLLGVAMALAVMAACFLINLGGAWMGGPAEAGELAVTLCYCVFWGIFSVVTRKIRSLSRFSFVLSLLTLISAAAALICRLTDTGFIVVALISVFASVPMYGLTFWLDWTGVYAVALGLALLWLLFAAVNLRRLDRELGTGKP